MKKIHDSEVPAQGQQVITACAFIYHNVEGVFKLFMPQRADTKKFLPGVYEIPGGHIEYGENIIDGLKREIKEEIAMDIEVGEIVTAETYINEIKGAHAIQVTYLAEFIGNIDDIKLNPEDHSGYRWVGEGEIDEIKESNGKGEDTEIIAIRKGFLKLKNIKNNTNTHS